MKVVTEAVAIVIVDVVANKAITAAVIIAKVHQRARLRMSRMTSLVHSLK